MSEEEKGLRPILLVEDDDKEVTGCIRKFEASGILNQVVPITTAAEAFEFLTRRGRHAGSTHRNPGVILMSLSLPDAYGGEFLEFLKGKSMKIPIVVLTDSETTQSPAMLRNVGADGIMEKPIGLDGFLRAVKPLEPDWLEIKQVGRPVEADQLD
jgi:DNA-binding response OmpR family regulator